MNTTKTSKLLEIIKNPKHFYTSLQLNLNKKKHCKYIYINHYLNSNEQKLLLLANKNEEKIVSIKLSLYSYNKFNK